MVVFEPAFWDQSRNTLPGRFAFVMVAVTSFGCSPWSSSATSLASAVDSSEGSRFGRSAYRWRPLLPLVTGLACSPRAASLSRTSSATVQHSCSPAGSPGSRSTTSRSALRGRPLRPTVHWWTCSSSAARLTSQVRVARSSMIGKTSVSPPLDPVLLEEPREPVGRHRDGAHPRRRSGGDVLLEEAGPLHAVRPADPGHRPVREVRQQHRRDAGVVVEHLALGGAGARVEDLVEVADPQRAALDVDKDLGLGRAHRPIAITGTRSGSSRAISPRRNGRGALTHPAVAPSPLTCRKIPAPRCRTWWELNEVTIEYSYCTG